MVDVLRFPLKLVAVLYQAYPWKMTGVAISKAFKRHPYTALLRMEKLRLVESEWVDEEAVANGIPSARYYRLTRKCRDQIKQMIEGGK